MIWPFLAKMPKNGFFFRIFLGILSILFSETLQLIRAFNSEKMFKTLFRKNPVLAILAKNWSKWAIWLEVWMCLFKGWKSRKNLKVGVFETDFKQVPFVFRQITCKYSESWGPVENLLKKGYKNEVFSPFLQIGSSKMSDLWN